MLLSEMPIVFRAANIDDLSLLKKWESQPHIQETIPGDDWNWEKELIRNPEWREQLIAEVDNRAIGFFQIIDPEIEETQYWGAMGPGYRAIDIWIGMAEDLGKGYGSEMMRQGINKCFENASVSTILIDPLESNIRAHIFYQRLGFEFVEKRKLEGVDCLIFKLSKDKWEQGQRG